MSDSAGDSHATSFADRLLPAVYGPVHLSMAAHVALLRAVNLPSHNKVGSAELRALMAKLELEEGQTLLQSGNLVFDSEGRTPAALEALLTGGAQKQLGLVTEFFVR